MNRSNRPPYNQGAYRPSRWRQVREACGAILALVSLAAILDALLNR